MEHGKFPCAANALAPLFLSGCRGAFSGTEATIGDGMKKLIETLIEMAYAQIGTLELQIESYKHFLDTLEEG